MNKIFHQQKKKKKIETVYIFSNAYYYIKQHQNDSGKLYLYDINHSVCKSFAINYQNY